MRLSANSKTYLVGRPLGSRLYRVSQDYRGLDADEGTLKVKAEQAGGERLLRMELGQNAAAVRVELKMIQNPEIRRKSSKNIPSLVPVIWRVAGLHIIS